LFRTMFVPSFDIFLHFQNGALRLDVTDKQSIKMGLLSISECPCGMTMLLCKLPRWNFFSGR
jgi:hypothetical protein